MVTSADAETLYHSHSGDVFKWETTALTYSFPTHPTDYVADYNRDQFVSQNELATFTRMYLAAHAVFERAFERYAEISQLTFEELDPGQGALIDIAASAAPSVAYAYFPSTFYERGGDIWFDIEARSQFDPLAVQQPSYDGSYVFVTIMHEIGHALGLFHGHEGDEDHPALAPQYDGAEYSIMTYRSYVGDPNAGSLENAEGSYQQTPMVLDIAAIQALYGANYDTAAGNTVYVFDPDTGQVRRDGEVLTDPTENVVFLTLWDGGGIDTLDFSEYRTALDIDLRPGEGSDLDANGLTQSAELSSIANVFAPSNFYVSLDPENDGRALIENVIGGDGDDVFLGNSANNTFWGGLGLDSYEGLGGADTASGLVSELAGDSFQDFSAGDLIEIQNYTGPVSVSQTAHGLELVFSGGSLSLLGDFAADLFEITTLAGSTLVQMASDASTLLSVAGERFITTDAGENRVFGDLGDDVVATADGDDLAAGGGGSDVLITGGGADILIGGASGDILTGGAGSDIFSFDISDFGSGETIADFITDFETGIDTIELTGFELAGIDSLDFLTLASGDAIDLGEGRFVVLEGIDAADLSAGDISISDFARKFELIGAMTQHKLSDAADRFVTTDDGPNEIFGLGGIDALIGGGGADILRGGDDGDVLVGGGDADRLIGGQGADRLTGGAGGDVFEFTSGEETGFVAEFITDYSSEDSILLSGFGFTDTDELSFGSVSTGDVSLALTDTRFVVFEGIADATMLNGAFEFA